MSDDKRIPTDGGGTFGHNPFATLKIEGLPVANDTGGTVGQGGGDQSSAPKKKNRGRVDIIRQTAHRGGKTVTVVTNFVGIGLPEKEKLARLMQKTCGSLDGITRGAVSARKLRAAQVGDAFETLGNTSGE